MAEDVSSTIAALEDERYTAMLSGDAAKLDRLLDDRLRPCAFQRPCRQQGELDEQLRSSLAVSID